MILKFHHLLTLLLLLACQKESTIRKIFEMPKKLKENSGIEITPKSKRIWTLQDSGNDAEIYGLDAKGKIVETIAITNVQNHDWEDISSDNAGNLYIGDFGNNDNDRKNLSIYKVDATQLNSESAAVSVKINFYFPEQKAFPPKKSELVYDIESFFVWQDNFYLFTKNRSSKFNGETTLYLVPNKAGNHAAKKIGEFKTCGSYGKCAVTSADISPDGKKVALLTSAYVWIFTGFTGNNIFNGKSLQIDLEHVSQKEGLCFSGNNTLLISDEKKKSSGGNVYELSLN